MTVNWKTKPFAQHCNFKFIRNKKKNEKNAVNRLCCILCNMLHKFATKRGSFQIISKGKLTTLMNISIKAPSLFH